MSNALRTGGYAACLVLIVGGAATLAVGLDKQAEVGEALTREKIVGAPDMKPGGIAPAAELGSLPTCDVARQPIDSGAKAKCFADYMRVHALKATGGKTYAELPRAVTADSKQPVPNDQADAALANGTAIDNPQRQLWVTETSLSTALNTAFFAESVARLAMWIGTAFLLVGISLLMIFVSAGRKPSAAPRSRT